MMRSTSACAGAAEQILRPGGLSDNFRVYDSWVAALCCARPVKMSGYADWVRGQAVVRWFANQQPHHIGKRASWLPK